MTFLGLRSGGEADSDQSRCKYRLIVLLINGIHMLLGVSKEHSKHR